MMALVHDLAEAQGVFADGGIRTLISFTVVGDITPREGISKAEKRMLEAVSNALHKRG